MVAKIKEKRCVACSYIDSVIRYKLHECQMLTRASKSPLDIQSQGIFHGLNHPLALTINLWIKCRTKLEIHTEQVKKGLLELANKMEILIRYYHFWDTVQLEDMIHKEFAYSMAVTSFVQ